VNDDGLSFWDQRTIYVEPHTRDLCKTPAKVAHWLQEHGKMRDKWLPIQAVKTIYNSCAFVILSGNVTHEGMWQKWRDLDKPEYWKIMTKVEHTKRTDEYLALLAIDNPKMKKRTKGTKDDSKLGQPERAKKRKRKQPIAATQTVDNATNDADANAAESGQQTAVVTISGTSRRLLKHDRRTEADQRVSEVSEGHGTKISFDD
jgi:hypothetical protein